MKHIILIISILGIITAYGCHDVTVGFLKTENAEYTPDTMIVHRNLDPTRLPDMNMIESGAEWASNEISGVLGTNPLIYSIEDVKATEGGNADLFKKQARIIGGGRIYIPSKDLGIPAGTYVLTIKVSNPGYTAVLDDIFTVIVQED